MIAGAQRSGTTFLARLLSYHPGIFMAEPLVPEPKYFLPGRRPVFSLEEYRELFFKKASPSMMLGEKSVSYFEIPGTPELIHKHIPDARLIFVLRNPVVRAISNYHYSQKHGFEKRPLEDVFCDLKDLPASPKDLGISASPYAYLARGHYADMLGMFEAQFGRGRMHIFVLESWLQADRPLRPLLDFLEVDPGAEKKMKSEIRWQESETPGRIPSALRLRLERYYEPLNQVLSRRFGLDLTAWSAG